MTLTNSFPYDDSLKQILENTTYKSIDEKLALMCSFLSLYFNGEQVKIFAPMEKSSIADYFVLCTAQGQAQSQSLTMAMKKMSQTYSLDLRRVEGEGLGQWILLDFSSVIVHIFDKESREIYNLDELYKNFSALTLPEYFYTGLREPVKPKTTLAPSQSPQDYF
jgi:ribosome-associated protein